MLKNRDMLVLDKLYWAYFVMNSILIVAAILMVLPAFGKLNPFQKSWFWAEVLNSALSLVFFLYEWTKV